MNFNENSFDRIYIRNSITQKIVSYSYIVDDKRINIKDINDEKLSEYNYINNHFIIYSIFDKKPVKLVI